MGPLDGDRDGHHPDGARGGDRGEGAAGQQQAGADLAGSRGEGGERPAAEAVVPELLGPARESAAAEPEADLLYAVSGDQQSRQEAQDEQSGVHGRCPLPQPAACGSIMDWA